MTKRPSPGALAAVLIGGAAALAALAGLIGFGIGHYTKATAAATTTSTVRSPTGHSGAGLPAHEIGDSARGARLFVSKGCALCHSYGGKGGTDAPPLDYMAGHLSAKEVANMSGTIWNHLPVMLPRFQKEGIRVPTFTGDQMADLIAFLHSEPTARTATTTRPGSMEMQPTKPGSPARGKSVFTTLGCGSCHTLAAAGTDGTVGPNLDSSLEGKSAAYIEQSILEPNAVVAKGFSPNIMPAFGATITKQQLADLVSFLSKR